MGTASLILFAICAIQLTGASLSSSEAFRKFAGSDGMLSLHEFSELANFRAEEYDDNENGVIDMAEAVTMAQRFMKRFNINLKHFGPVTAADLMQTFDTNSDAVFSGEEWNGTSTIIFNKIDQNGDGRISQAEFGL